MRFNLLVVLASLTATLQVGAATSKPSSLAQCGENPEVVKSMKIPFKDTEVVITSFACPGIAKSSNTSTTLSKRQIDVCGAACTLECVDFDDPTPLQGDCVDLGDALVDTGGFFIAPSETVTTATLGTCISSWINESADEFEYCFVDWGEITADGAIDCIPSASGAACVDSAELWLIEVFG